MGWYYGYRSRDALIQELIKPQESKSATSQTIVHSLQGKVLWSVVRVTSKEAGYMNLSAGESCCYIACDLLERTGGDWGYKPMEESMHPYYYSCPLKFLKMAPVKSAEWRDGVRAYHGKLKSKRPQGLSMEVAS